MKKIIEFFKSHWPTRRRFIQVYAALLYNANLKGFISGKIYTGPTKSVCVPGMNCYSCPGAGGACPLGSLQNSLADKNHKATFYIVGILILYGLILGRTICGWLCPFGLIQEWLYKIKSWKLKKNKVTYILSYLKYFLLIFMAIIIPIVYGIQGLTVPAFCKYICPSGTLEGAGGLLLNPNNDVLFGMLGILFTWKTFVLIVMIVGSIFIFRPFCRFICPLGALYGLFAKFNILGVKLNKSSCTNCGKCISVCKADIRHVGDKECIHCGECISSCPVQAISFSGSKLILAPNEAGNNVSKMSGEELIGSNIPSIPNEQPKEEIKEVKQKKQFKVSLKVVDIVLAVFCILTLSGALIYYNVFDKPKVKPSSNQVGEVIKDFKFNLFTHEEYNFSSKDGLKKANVIYCLTTIDKDFIDSVELYQESHIDDVNTYVIFDYTLNVEAHQFYSEYCMTSKITYGYDSVDKDVFNSFSLGENNASFRVLVSDEGKIQELNKDNLDSFSSIDKLINGVVVGSKIGDIVYSMDLEGCNNLGTININDYRGKIVILNFWYPHCGPCVQELPYFEEIQEKYLDDVVVIAVCGGFEADISQDFIDENYSTWKITFANDNEDGDYYNSLADGQNSFPITYIIDEEGIIHYKMIGSIPHSPDNLNEIADFLDNEVQKIMNK